MSVKCQFITNLIFGKVDKENHIRKVRKSEERKVKNIGKAFENGNIVILLTKVVFNQKEM